jgi:GR25 family glycosyltransferase involved in LPS biosynthesis
MEANVTAHKINTFFDKIFCINIDRRTDRWHNNCIPQFSKLNLCVERADAVDGDLDEYNLGNPRCNQLAGAESHTAVIQKCYDENLDSALILEDDVIFCDNIHEKFNAYIDQVPSDWDILLFGGNHQHMRYVISENLHRVFRTYALHAYGVNKKAYNTILDYMNECISMSKDIKPTDHSLAADWYMSDLQPKLNVYCFNPHIAWQMDDFSDILKEEVNYDFLKP